MNQDLPETGSRQSSIETAPLNDRQAQIVERVEQQGFVTIEQLARDFAVSAQTVRREIIRLDERGVLRRFHGGAGRSGSGMRLSYEAKLSTDADLKARIGAAAAGLLNKGETIFLDVGTTGEAVAHALSLHSGLRIITPSASTARVLAANPHLEVVLTGGRIVGADMAMIGPIAVRTVASYRFDHVLIGCSGIGADGAVLDFDADKIAVKQQALLVGARKLLIADSGKFGRSALMEVARLPDFDIIVTDAVPASCRVLLGDEQRVVQA